MVKYLGVFKPNQHKTQLLEPVGSLRVVGHALGMRVPIQLDNQPCSRTIKVNYETIHRKLAAKFESVQLAIAERTPQYHFGWRGIAS